MHKLATLVGPAALALKELKIDREPANGCYVRIVGRKSGLLDWILSILGIDTTTVFEVFTDHIRFTEANLSGRITSVFPLTAISASASGYFKPILYLILGVPLIAFFGLGLIFILYYFLHKTLLVTATTHSGEGAAIAFKRSVVEGIKIEQKQAEEIIEIINHLTLHQQRK